MSQIADDVVGRPRLAWFCDLEAFQENLAVLRVLRDELGLTTLVPESHLCHTSGFAPSSEVIAASPLEGWRASPTLHLHRSGFHISEPAFAVLPGVVSGFDDTFLRRVIDECRRLGLEVWGHAGLWSYGGEVFPALAARDLFEHGFREDGLSWGTGFCPSKPELHSWIKLALADVVSRYDLDGMFVDHARYTSPGYGPALLTCGCADCEDQANRRGYDFDEFRDGLTRLRGSLGRMSPSQIAELASAGPIETIAFAAEHPGVLDWFIFRARLLADQFADIAGAVRDAAQRPFPFGSDVFPPSVALLGGQIYREWARGATFFTGGFGGRIGWSTVGQVTIDNLAPWLRSWVPNLDGATAALLIAHLIGYDHDSPGSPAPDSGELGRPENLPPSFDTEIGRMARASGGVPVYPPVAGGLDLATLKSVCEGIAKAGLSGAMFSGLDTFSPEQRRIVRTALAEPLLG